MIITAPKHLESEKKRIEDFYPTSSPDMTIELGSPHRIIFQNQPYQLDFNTQTYQRLISNQHPLLSAIGKNPTQVLDAFGGLGKDGFILSHQQHQVTTCEINPILYLLLSQALNAYPGKLNWTIHHQDALCMMKKNSFEVVYLDPMFTDNKTAKPKLAMQVIQALASNQPFENWQTAYQAATKRLVIKQHQSSPTVSQLPKPSLQIKGKRSVRYDIYLK